MLNLICEGDCNGGLVQEFDALIREYGRTTVETADGSTKETSTAPAGVLAMTKEMVYTPHLRNGSEHASCLKCGTMRRWRS